jgi:hypothetical protein
MLPCFTAWLYGPMAAGASLVFIISFIVFNSQFYTVTEVAD